MNPTTSSRIRVVPLRRTDWLQVFWKGAFDWQFWNSSAAPTRPAFRWYLERVSDAVDELVRDIERGGGEGSDGGTTKVVLLGHSAGGWLARAAMGFGTSGGGGDTTSDMAATAGTGNDGDDDDGIPSFHFPNKDRVVGIVTLGTPHLPPPPTVMDMTRGALRITNERFPGAHFGDSIFYLTVCGEAVRGSKRERRSNNPFEPTTLDGFAYDSYEVVCGAGDEMGDGVVPTCAAHLDGATQLTLPGVLHSINAPDNWYGSDAVVDSWHDAMLREINRCCRTKQSAPTVAK